MNMKIDNMAEVDKKSDDTEVGYESKRVMFIEKHGDDEESEDLARYKVRRNTFKVCQMLICFIHL